MSRCQMLKTPYEADALDYSAAVASAADDAACIGPGPRAAAMAGVVLPGTEVELESSGRLASAGWPGRRRDPGGLRWGERG